MRSSRMVIASDSQCRSCNCPGFYLSILWHSLTWGAPDEAVLNKVRREKINRPFTCLKMFILRWFAWEWPPPPFPHCRPRVLSVDTGWATHQLFSSPSWTLQVRIINIHMKMPVFRICIKIRSHFVGWIRIRNENADQAKLRKREGSKRLQESVIFFRSSKWDNNKLFWRKITGWSCSEYF